VVSGHTPGPWRLQHGVVEGWKIRLGDHRVEYFGDKDDEGVANLRLMASAPDLLAACIAMGNAITPAEVEAAYVVMSAAILKATGEAAS
jgi:hypothetical protein